MRKYMLLSLATCAVLAVTPIAPGYAKTVHQSLVCKDSGWAVVFPCGLPEDAQVPGSGSYDTGNAFGKVSYANDAAANRIQFRATGLERNTWYLVTLQDPTGSDQFSVDNGVSCLFGIQGTGTGLEFCDIALVKTNNGGSVEEIIPSDSGLTGNGIPTCTSSNVPGLSTGPTLGDTGVSYSGLTLVVKNVGVGDDGTAPNCTTLIGGGSAELFEMDALPGFTN